MPTLIIETKINAPPGICFDSVRDVSLYLKSNEKDFENFRSKKSHGEIVLNETVAFERKVFGVSQTLKVKVTELEKPFRFTDEMIEGNFKSFKHVHEFIPEGGQTLMRDTLVWTSPFGILGKIVDAVWLKSHLRKIVIGRNAELKRAAENYS